jgi:hypothetical protein
MDKIILHSQDVETLLQWRDNNAELVRRNAAPFKGIMLEFPETKIEIKTHFINYLITQEQLEQYT